MRRETLAYTPRERLENPPTSHTDAFPSLLPLASKSWGEHPLCQDFPAGKGKTTPHLRPTCAVPSPDLR
ncbi:MAG: hypothetical protein ACFNUE_06835, partial [Bacteroides sp.]